ncbi:alpha/beta hydrolase [Streptosporangium sp. NPDC048865]|uniref:alpha/beta hydrolase n=1 Tax=Streptosporangium sp. NPDC048865 TaxID=3155766 RepID=UPI00342DE6BA
MEPTKTSTLKVPGATLYHEIRGSGPTLLLICGGVYDAAGYAALAGRLADRYTVVTYDRRGNSRSPLDGPPEPQSIEVHADDAHRLLAEAGVTADEPAYVFGNSSGAIIGLELAARHPEQVRVLVSHEPPLFELLPDRDRWRGVVRDVEKAFAEEGTGAAMQALSAAFATDDGEQAGSGERAEDTRTEDGPAAEGPERVPGGAPAPQGEPDRETMETMARIERNMEFFIGYEVPPFSRYAFDAAALGASSVRVVSAVGEESEGEPPYRAAAAVAGLLGTRPTAFPGDHGGFGSQPEAFAAKLHQVLSST